MKYMVSISFVDVLGYILPHALCSLRLKLSPYDLQNIAAEGDGQITRDAVEQWLTSNSGDFSNVVDFYASLEWHGKTVTFDWTTEENECAYMDTLGDGE